MVITEGDIIKPTCSLTRIDTAQESIDSEWVSNKEKTMRPAASLIVIIIFCNQKMRIFLVQRLFT